MLTNHRIRIATLVVVAAALGTSPAHADGKNEIRAVSYDDDSGTTRIHVRGAQTPTFTVYKLERPTRVVIDLPQARLAENLRGHESATMLASNTWAVSTIAAQQLDDGGQVVRVIVTLARPGRYDVKTEGSEVLVSVTARDAAPKTASPEALAKAQAESEQAKAAAASAEQARVTAEQANAKAQSDAERLRKVATDQAAKAQAAQKALDDASQQHGADIERAKANATAAQAEAARAKAEAAKAKETAASAQQDANKMRDAAETARRQAVAETEVARAEAAKAKQDVARTKAEMQAQLAKDKADADAAKREAEVARSDAEKQKRAELDAAKRDGQAKIDAAKRDAEQGIAASRAETDAARLEATKAKNDVATAKAEAARARSEAQAARAEAEATKAAAAADKQKAEAERGQAEKLMRDAKQQLATLDRKTAVAQEMEDKARAAHAAAQAREEAARDAAARADRERIAAEDAAKLAAAARDQSTTQAKSERERLATEARAAEARLATAKQATAEAEQRRTAAESAVSGAKHDLEQTRTALATVEHQRTAAETAASEAARKRGEAEAAATDASRRRSEAEIAAADATKKRSEAERATNHAVEQRKIAEDAAKAADQQRTIAEGAAKTAGESKHQAEIGLAELTTRRDAAERAAAEVEQRTRAEAKAQAEVAAAKARKAGEEELEKVRTEATRLVAERKRAEAELADRRKAVAAQQAEADRLKVAAAAAHDAADREEARRAQLAGQRVAEETELARVKAQKPTAVPVVQPVVAKVAPSAKVHDITFKGADNGGDVDIGIAGEAKVTLGEVSAGWVELVIDSAELGAKLERKLDVSRFGGPILSVSSFRDRHAPNRVRLIAELASPVTPTMNRDATGVHWHLASNDLARRVHTQNVPPTVVSGFGAVSSPVAQQSVTQLPARGRSRVYHGQTVTLDFKDAPIRDLLRFIAATGDINIVVPDSIDFKVTLRLVKVPWDQALEVILASHGLWYRRDGKLYRIATRKEIDTEDQEEAARRQASLAAESPRTDLIPLNYADADDLKRKLEPMLSQKGKIEVDERTNQLIVNDVAGNREQINKLANSLDTQTPQIAIEARIVEAQSTFLRQIGVQWGGNALASATGGNATGLSFPSSVALTGANSDANTIATGVANPSNFAINLPAATGSGEGGAIGLALGSISGNFNMNLRLSALEDAGTVRIISAPKVTVQNNQLAKISQGVSIPISVVSAAGTQTQFVQADLSLQVTPKVSQRDCAISMKLVITKNEPDFVNTGARGDPTILRKEAKTTMIVQDGETSVLGGIYTRNSGLAYKKVPWLGDIPVIGWLFKNRTENDNRTEVLVFITPKITNRALLHCQ